MRAAWLRQAYDIHVLMSESPSNTDWHAQGVSHFRAGQLDAAQLAFESAWAEAQRANDKRRSAEAANDLGVTFQKLKQRDRAKRQFETAIALFAELRDDPRRAQALGNLGTLLGDMRKFREAEVRLEQAATVFHQTGDLRSESLTLKWLSRVHLQHGDVFGALLAYERALARLEPLPVGQRLLRRFLQIPLRMISHG